jgi:CrcB protein
MYHLFLVFVGGGAGAAGRHLVNLASLNYLGVHFPWGTLTVNIVGSLVMGLVIELLALRLNVSTEIRLLVGTGFLGGFTTFSAFSLDVALLWERGQQVLAAGYVLASVLGALAALFAGLAIMRHILS